MENKELSKDFKEHLIKENRTYEEFINDICKILKEQDIHNEIEAKQLISLAMIPCKYDESVFNLISEDVFNRCVIIENSREFKDILDRNFELSDWYKLNEFKAQGMTQDEYIEKFVNDMFLIGAVSVDDMILYCKVHAGCLENFVAFTSLIKKKLENFGHKKQTFIDFAQMNQQLAKSARADYNYANRNLYGDLKSDTIHDALVLEGEYNNKVDRIKPLLKIDFEDTSDLVKIEFETGYGDNVEDYEYRLINGDEEPDMDIVTIRFPEESEYYGYSWYYDRKLLKENKNNEAYVYIELPKNVKIAIFAGEEIKYISSDELKEEMVKVPVKQVYEEQFYDLSEELQDYLEAKGKTLDVFIYETCEDLKEKNILVSSKICDALANFYLPPYATSHDLYDVMLPIILDNMPIINS